MEVLAADAVAGEVGDWDGAVVKIKAYGQPSPPVPLLVVVGGVDGSGGVAAAVSGFVEASGAIRGTNAPLVSIDAVSAFAVGSVVAGRRAKVARKARTTRVPRGDQDSE